MCIDELIEKLLLNGSKFNSEELKLLRAELYNYKSKDYSLDDILNLIIFDLKEKTEEFLYRKDEFVSGISTSIAFSSDKYINIIGGTKSRGSNCKIDDDTLFDIASITKFYTGLLVLHLRKLGLLNTEDEINSLTSSFNLSDYTIEDIMNMRGIISTPKRIDGCTDSKEALKALKDIYIKCRDKGLYNYTDMGLIVLSLILEEKFNQSYSDILNTYLIEPLNLQSTYYPNSNITGNGRLDNKPNDPKAIILDRPIGSAGIFASGLDLVKIGDYIFNGNYLSFEDLKEFCIHKYDVYKGIFGSFVRIPSEEFQTYVPNEYSKYSFAFEGYTGSIAAFDLINKIHHNILVNPMYEGTLKKPANFKTEIIRYQHLVALASLKLFIASKTFPKDEGFVKKIKI